jgi:uncharacterized protein (DUF362 family)/Pyruvate/2-oxoacid:ferredoxin oxidoreductase delta subunit
MEAFVKPGARVLLKPNLLAPFTPNRPVTTHPEVVRAVSREVRRAGGRLFIGDSPAVGSLALVLKISGIMQVIRDLEIETVVFRTPVQVPVKDGGVYRTLKLAEEAAGYDLILNLPKFKTHGMMTLTLAVKNMFGTVVGAAKPAWHLQTRDQLRFADMLLDICRTLPPALNIMDGITAMEGGGPSTGDPLQLGLLMASPSVVAMDAVAGAIAGVPPEKHPVIYQARIRKLPGSRDEEVRTLGVTIHEVRKTFRLPGSASRVDFRLPDWLRRSMKKSLNPFPELAAGKCTSCGQCAKICPTRAIALHGKPADGGVVDVKRCISCFCCQETCPEGAIDIVPGRLLRILRKVNLA